MDSISSQGAKTLHAAGHSQKKKKKKHQTLQSPKESLGMFAEDRLQEID